ncbi:hypothetical protein AB4Z22_07850, partial [Paenibacillus sp. TAF58]
MKWISRELWKTMLVLIVCCGFMSSNAYAEEKADLKAIPEWSIMWGDPPGGLEAVSTDSSNQWIKVNNGKSSPKKPEEVSSAWIRFQLPSNIPKDYGIYIEGVYTQNLWVYIGNRLVREIKFDFPIDRQRSLFSVSSEDGGGFVYLKLETSKDRLGIHSAIKLDDYAGLTRSFALQDLSNIILGCAFLFIAASTLIGSFFLKKSQLINWALVSVLNLTLGIIFITYSAFLYANFT